MAHAEGLRRSLSCKSAPPLEGAGGACVQSICTGKSIIPFKGSVCEGLWLELLGGVVDAGGHLVEPLDFQLRLADCVLESHAHRLLLWDGSILNDLR